MIKKRKIERGEGNKDSKAGLVLARNKDHPLTIDGCDSPKITLKFSMKVVEIFCVKDMLLG